MKMVLSVRAEMFGIAAVFAQKLKHKRVEYFYG